MEKNKKDNPLVSVIIPVYNIPKNYLEKCLNSVLGQSYNHLEIIIINDCSPNLDNEKTIRSYTHIDNRIYFINLKSNGGVSNARNLGLKKANGTWVTFVDADDILMQNAIETMVNEAMANHVEIVMSNIQFDKNEEQTDFLVINQKYKIVQNTQKSQYLVETIKDFQLSVCGKLYNKSILDNIEFPVGISNFEDYIFLWEVILRYPKYLILDKVGYEACYRSDSASRNTNNSAKCIRMLSSLAYAVDKIDVLFPQDYSVRDFLTGFIIRESFANRFLLSHPREDSNFLIYQNARNLYNKMIQYNLVSPLLLINLRQRLFFIGQNNWLNYLSYYLLRIHYRVCFK